MAKTAYYNRNINEYNCEFTIAGKNVINVVILMFLMIPL